LFHADDRFRDALAIRRERSAGVSPALRLLQKDAR